MKSLNFRLKNICQITAGIKKYKSIIKEKNHNKIVLLGKAVRYYWSSNFKALIDSYISHDDIFSVNNELREYNEIKEELKNPETSMECTT